MERRIEEPDRDRQPAHRLEDPVEIGLLERQQLGERLAAARLVVGEDHPLHHRQPLVAEEHVLGAAEADPLGAELARADGVGGVVGVRADLEPSEAVGPAEDRLEVVVQLRRHELDRTEVHRAAAAVDRDRIALVQLMPAEPCDAVLERQPLAAGDAGLPHSPGDDRGVRGHAAVDGQDPVRRDHPVDVVRRRLVAHEDHRPCLRALDRRVAVEDDPAGGGAGARVQALRDRVGGRIRVDPRMKELVELARIDPEHRLFAADRSLVDHLDRRLHRGRRGALGGAGLEHEERPVLDRELDVLHVAVVLLEPAERREELLVGLRHDLRHRLHRLRRTDPGDDVFTLGVREELAVELLRAGRRVAGEDHPGPGAVALVAEDHLDDVHRGADVVGDLVRVPVHLRPRRVPRVEDGAHRTHQLLGGLLREIGAHRLAVDRTEGADELRRGRRPRDRCRARRRGRA